MNTGTIKSHKGINIPNVKITLPSKKIFVLLTSEYLYFDLIKLNEFLVTTDEAESKYGSTSDIIEVSLYKFENVRKGGKFKATDNIIQEEDCEGNKSVRFRPLSAWETPEAITNLCIAYNEVINDKTHSQGVWNEIIDANKTLKSALERKEKLEKFRKIVKEKKVDFRLLKKCDDINTYNYLYAQRYGYEPDYMDNQLTETEFNLLKEML